MNPHPGVPMIIRLEALALLLALPTLAVAQSPVDPDRGASISLRASGSGVIGLWLPAGARTDAGAEVGLSVSRDRNAGGALSTWGGDAGLFVRRYLAGHADREVVSYLIAGPTGSYSRTGGASDSPRLTTVRVGGLVGAGMEWFPASRVSVGGHVGVELSHRRTRRAVTGFRPGEREETVTSLTLATTTSGIVLRLHLP